MYLYNIWLYPDLFEDVIGKRDTKIGQCPPIPAEFGFGVCASVCERDSQCDGAKKCCSTPCGGTLCLDALPGQTGKLIKPDGNILGPHIYMLVHTFLMTRILHWDENYKHTSEMQFFQHYQCCAIPLMFTIKHTLSMDQTFKKWY